jgi:uncharacterized protein YqjF (DUF2071 family)
MSASGVIDRVAPTVRPEGPAGGRQKWRDLLFLHWAVPAAAVRPLIPPQLELDLHDGVLYVGVVPFAMSDVRPKWLPNIASFDFLETNVRTYVVHRGRPGVFFFSLEAASALACTAARATFGLPYYWAAMTMTKGEDGIVSYVTRRRLGPAARSAFRYRPGAHLGPSEPGTLQHFLLERYLLFVARGGAIHCGRVHHTPYPAHAAELLEVHDELVSAARLPGVIGPPAHVHWSPGVDVEVFDLTRVE